MVNKLKYYRTIVNKLSMEELEKRSGVSRATISKIENSDDLNVNTKTLVALAQALNTTVEAIFFGDSVK